MRHSLVPLFNFLCLGNCVSYIEQGLWVDRSVCPEEEECPTHGPRYIDSWFGENPEEGGGTEAIDSECFKEGATDPQ